MTVEEAIKEIKVFYDEPEEMLKKQFDHEMRVLIYAKKAAEAEGKTVPQILEEIAGQFCEHYCKYPDTWDIETEGCDLCESEICAECPINKLV